MSNLVKAILASDTGERKAIKPKTSQLFNDVFRMKENISETYDTSMYAVKLYKIGVTLGNSCLVTELDYRKNAYALEHAIVRTKKQVIEAVFGEFRPDFRAIERYLYNYEFEEAALALRKMEDRMFSTEG